MASTKVSAATNTATVTDDSRFLVAHTDDEGSSYSSKSITRENLFKDLPATVVVGSTGTTDRTSATGAFSGSTFDGTYTRNAGFTLDTASPSGSSALFDADSDYYYYVMSNDNAKMLIFSKATMSGKWVLVHKSGSDFRSSAVSDDDALGSATEISTDPFSLSSETVDSKIYPAADGSKWVFSTSGGTLTDAANDSAAASAGVAVNQLYRNGSVVMIRVS